MCLWMKDTLDISDTSMSAHKIVAQTNRIRQYEKKVDIVYKTAQNMHHSSSMTSSDVKYPSKLD